MNEQIVATGGWVPPSTGNGGTGWACAACGYWIADGVTHAFFKFDETRIACARCGTFIKAAV